MNHITIAALLLLGATGARAADGFISENEQISNQVAKLQESNEALEHRLDELAKAVDDLAWQTRLSDVAVVDKWRIVGPPQAKPKNPKALGAKNPVKFFIYTFVPKDLRAGDKRPLLVLPHGGVHASLESQYTAHTIRELLEQGYVVVAPEYRGSTGYGKEFYELIDYGGLEIEDAQAARDWAVENLEGVDPARVGLIGWSHGGLIALMAAFAHAKDYQCIFAGVPVSDLVQRMGYSGDGYREMYSAGNHLGATAEEDLEEYKRRSPVWNAEKLQTPLLVHTNTTDEDVAYIEVEHLIQALKAAGKKFEYKVFQDAPGGHSMDRLDTKLAREARRDIYRFLAKYLKPPRPPR
jgi:dipeptidyl aminopeptidase/acylaminoacyl peptidase